MEVRTHTGFWNRSSVARDISNCYLFGDNTEDRTKTHYVPKMTQAVIRGLPNAVGIDTKKNRRVFEDSYLTDADFPWFASHVAVQIQKAREYVKKTGGDIILPANGIGTGKAQLDRRAPKCFTFLQNTLRNLKIS